MKSVKNQYIDLKEGKMTEAQFMRNVRMSLPQYISNVTLFKQAERILINKGIIQEGIHDRDILSSPYTNVKSLEQSPEQLSKAADDRSENMLRMKYSNQIQDPNISDDELRYLLSGKGVKGFGGRPNAINKIIVNRNSNKIEALNSSDESALEKIVSKYVKDADDISKEMDAYFERGYQGFSDALQAKLSRDEEFQTWTTKGHDEETFRRETGDMPGFEGTLDALDKISIREGLEGYYNQDGKEQYSKFDELDNMNAQEIMAGYVMEKIDNPNIDQKEAIKLVIKNLKKDQFYYTNYKLTGIRGVEPVEFPSPKRKAGFDKPEEVSKKADNLIDTKNATQVIKEGLDNRDIASQIYDELQNMGSYNDTDIDLKIKKRGLTGPDAEAVRMIIFDKDREDMNEAYKLLPDPSKVKLKELVRKMMKEMFDGRDNVTDVTGENN